MSQSDDQQVQNSPTQPEHVQSTSDRAHQAAAEHFESATDGSGSEGTGSDGTGHRDVNDPGTLTGYDTEGVADSGPE